MLFFVNSIISFAISTSLILDSDACIFSDALSRFLIVCSSLFCAAPSFDLCSDTFSMATFIVSIAAVALVNEATEFAILFTEEQ